MAWFAKAADLSSKFYIDWFRSSHLIAEFISIAHSDFIFLTGEMLKILVVLLIVCLASLQSSAIRPRWITRWVKTIIISPASFFTFPADEICPFILFYIISVWPSLQRPIMKTRFSKLTRKTKLLKFIANLRPRGKKEGKSVLDH